MSSSVLLLMFDESFAISSCTRFVLMQGIGAADSRRDGAVSVLVELLSFRSDITDLVPSTDRLSKKRLVVVVGLGLDVEDGGGGGASRSRFSGIDVPPDLSMLSCFLRKPGRVEVPVVSEFWWTREELPREEVRLVKPVRSSGGGPRFAEGPDPPSSSITVELRLVSPSIDRSFVMDELSTLIELFVSFELCLINRYGCNEYSVSVLEFFCKLSQLFL